MSTGAVWRSCEAAASRRGRCELRAGRSELRLGSRRNLPAGPLPARTQLPESRAVHRYVFTKVTVHQVRILVVGVVNGISALLGRQLPRSDVALAVNGVDLVAIRWRCLWIALFTLRLGPASDDEQVKCAAAWQAYLLHMVCRAYLRMLSSASQWAHVPRMSSGIAHPGTVQVLFFWHTLFFLRTRFCDRGPNCSPRSRARRVPEAWSSARPYLRAADPPQSCRRLVRRRRHPRRVDRGAATPPNPCAHFEVPRRAQAIACARVLSGATRFYGEGKRPWFAGKRSGTPGFTGSKPLFGLRWGGFEKVAVPHRPPLKKSVSTYTGSP